MEVKLASRIRSRRLVVFPYGNTQLANRSSLEQIIAPVFSLCYYFLHPSFDFGALELELFKMASKFRLNRYNWFGQKLLAQHQYDELITLRKHMTLQHNSETNEAEEDQQQRECSEHLTYLQGLALLKSSVNLDEVVFSLQRLNLERNSQHFLLLAQCLLYMGNYDSVVALCKQMINREIDAVTTNGGIADETNPDISSEGKDLLVFDTDEPDSYATIATANSESSGSKNNSNKNNNTGQSRLFPYQESIEFRKVLTSINRNQSINDPNLWLIFARCLEYQRQLKDARFAYQIATRLSLEDGSGGYRPEVILEAPIINPAKARASSVSNQLACSEYAKFCLRNGRDFRSAQSILGHISVVSPTGYKSDTLLALTIGAQANCSGSISRAVAIISSLEAHTKSHRNPSSQYNRLARKCRRLNQNLISHGSREEFESEEDIDGASRMNLSFILAKVYLVINFMVQESSRINTGDTFSSQAQSIDDQAGRLIELMLSTDPICWRSSSFWNNLGLLYLLRRKHVAALSCLLKANQISPLNWRVNLNLALACHRAGLDAKAAIFSLASKISRQDSVMLETHRFNSAPVSNQLPSEPHILTLMAINYGKLAEFEAARRVYLEAISQPIDTLGNSAGPAISVINYIIFLHLYENRIKEFDRQRAASSSNDHKQIVRLKIHLLDQLEQAWLQRSQNDCQFDRHFLRVATELSRKILNEASDESNARKSYAWMKLDLRSD